MNRQDEYKVYYYQNSHTKRIPVLEYIQKVAVKDRGKIAAYIHAFLKKTPKTPEQEIVRALNNFEDYKINKNFIEYEKET